MVTSMNADPSKNGTQIKNITPTVIVGLGGTGWEIIKRVQERLNYYIGGLHHYACINFLHVDTDKPRQGGWKDTAQTKHIHAHRGAEGLFDGVDSYGVRTWFQARGDETIKVFDTGAGQVRPYGRLAFFSNYTNNGIQDAIKTAFNNIKDKSARERLKASPKFQQVEEQTTISIDDEGNNNVIVIASIAGGTGSGMFFDMVTALRQQMNGRGMIYAYLLFPDNYREVSNLESMRANGYAFLKELEYFQLNNSNHRLEVKWPGDTTAGVAIQAILCDRVYLFSHTDELGRVTQVEDMFDSIAETIFKDFTFGGFADEKRSAENNENTDLHTLYVQNPVKDGFGNKIQRQSSRSFQSQGYSSLGMPHDQLIESCAYRLAAEVVNSWQPQNVEGRADSSTVDEALKSVGLRLALAGVSGGGSKRGKEDLNTTEVRTWCRQLKNRKFSGRDEDGDINALVLALLRKRDDASPTEMSWLDVETVNRCGEVTADSSQEAAAKLKSAVDDCDKGLQKRCDAYLLGLSNNVEKKTQERIEAWCQTQIANKMSFLDLTKVLQGMETKLTEMAQRLDVSLTTGLDKCRKAQWDIYVAFINKLGKYPEDNKVRGLRRLEKLCGVLDTQSERRALIEQVVKASFGQGDTLGFLEYSLYKCVITACHTLLERLAVYLHNLAGSFHLNNEGLSNAFAYLNERSKQARSVHSSQHIKSLFDGSEKSFDAVYTKALDAYHAEHSDLYRDDSIDDEDEARRKFIATVYKEISSRFVTKFGNLETINAALLRGFEDGQAIHAANDEWVAALLGITQAYFRYSLPQVCCFWERFAEDYNTPAKQREILEELYQNSAYWLDCDHSFTRTTLNSGGSEQGTFVLVGLPALPMLRDEALYNKLKDLGAKVEAQLTALANGLKVSVKVLPTCDELIIYRRSIALPLCYSNELPPMHEAYNEVRATGKPLHITWRNRIFADISLLTEASASASTRAVRTAALGLAFGIIRLTPRPMRPGDDTPIYDYTYVKSGIGEDVNFLGQSCEGDGVREIAEHMTVHDKSDIVADIERKCDKRLAVLRAADDDGYTMKYWAVYCQMLWQDVPRDIDKSGKEGPRAGHELEYAVYKSLLNGALEKLRGASWWKEEDAESSDELVQLAREQGDKLFKARPQDHFRLWQLPERK